MIAKFFQASKIALIIIMAMWSASSFAQVKKKKYIVNGYVGGYRGLVNADEIDAAKLTHINYAFVNVKDSMAFLTNLKTDSTNFRKLNELKKINPDLKIIPSIGGWSWSENFSDAVLTPSSRKKFAKSSVDIVREYKLDGVDIDWEYPGMRGEEGNVYRPEDKQNFTMMFEEIRAELDKLSAETGKKYLLTAAVGGSKSFVNNTEMDKVGKILDYILIMTYDYGGRNVSHHTNLYPSKGQEGGSSAHQSVVDFMAAGVPSNKIGLGAAFYSRSREATTTDQNGLLQASVSGSKAVAGQGGGYTKMKDEFIDQKGYKRYWDKAAQAPYLFNPENKVFLTYDDERSIQKKAKYIKKNKLAGIFFWEYFNDPKEYLLTEIDRVLP
ncbi:glycoside hydrolase family 18 protein [Daejeonella lutea]|uniref:chitinase n=1 Tax=Daejeonella lutea TaxID=572036 RepID=A0A1T5B954_9SPHI|nr:glycoside hydrolase family 18 protein [Daejeonella lutea]SKB43685.1 chitinase [Daejeonella lutea]